MPLLVTLRPLGAGGTNVTVSDSASATDASTLAVAHVRTDSATGADVAAQTYASAHTDSATGADAISARAFSLAEAAAAAETLARGIGTSDTAAGSESSTSGAFDARTTPPYQLPEAEVVARRQGTWNDTDVTRVDDDPDGPDSDTNYLTSTTEGRVAYRFPAPAYTLDASASALHLRARLTNPSGDDFDAKVRLLELISSVWTPVADTTVTVPAGTSDVYELAFTRSALADITGANVAVEVELLANPLG